MWSPLTEVFLWQMVIWILVSSPSHMVHARTGHDFNQYKRSTILRRVERRMQLNAFTTLEAYLDFLRHNAHEATAMFNDILIGVTNFFRDRDSWAALEQKAIPALMDKKK